MPETESNPASDSADEERAARPGATASGSPTEGNDPSQPTNHDVTREFAAYLAGIEDATKREQEISRAKMLAVEEADLTAVSGDPIAAKQAGLLAQRVPLGDL